MKLTEIVFASTNANKYKEITYLMQKYHLTSKFTLYSQEQYLLQQKQISNLDEIYEYGVSYAENAIIKGWRIASCLAKNVISDDSGIEISAYQSKPGLHSRRWKQELGTQTRNHFIVNDLKNNRQRQARFVCALAYVNYKQSIIKVFFGICQGLIAQSVDESCQKPFGYDPIFICQDNNKYYSQLSTTEKNNISHRGLAFAKLAQYLKNN